MFTARMARVATMVFFHSAYEARLKLSTLAHMACNSASWRWNSMSWALVSVLVTLSCGDEGPFRGWCAIVAVERRAHEGEPGGP